MSLPVFHYDAGPLTRMTPGSPLELTGAEGRHAATVKRLGTGERLRLIDGAGGWADAVVTAPRKNALSVEVEQTGTAPAPRPSVTVVQALPKAERAELAVDLATQAGADAIIPWQSDRCISKWVGPKVAKGVAKWEAAALAATKQSRRTRIPEISYPMDSGQLTELLRDRAGAETAVLVLHEEAAESIKVQDFTGVREIFLLVGPEGGIGPEELAALRTAGARAVRLGPEVVRTASAAMVALASLGSLTQRW